MTLNYHICMYTSVDLTFLLSFGRGWSCTSCQPSTSQISRSCGTSPFGACISSPWCRSSAWPSSGSSSPLWPPSSSLSWCELSTYSASLDQSLEMCLKHKLMWCLGESHEGMFGSYFTPKYKETNPKILNFHENNAINIYIFILIL